MGRSGRPRLKQDAGLRSVYITQEQYEHARNAGDGNFSAGVRHIIDNDISLHGKAKTSSEQITEFDQYIRRSGSK